MKPEDETLVRIASDMTDDERKKLKKEIQGLEAKLKWDHVSDGVKAGYEARIAELRRKLEGK
ncbi:MAG: hypothetical protein V4750_02670 [Pseudomonadota bacterium]